jgi:hypothetical protein
VGLFSSVLHARRVNAPELAAGLDTVMRDLGFVRRATLPMSREVLAQIPDDVAAFACGPLRGEWCTVVEVHDVFEEVRLVNICMALSKVLDTHVLTLDLHDEDVFYCYLDFRGEPLDAYDSDPMYFEQERLPESEIEAQRHSPEAFVPLLPPGVSIEALSALLDRGWWRAHDRGELDEDGAMADEAYDSDDYIHADHRMTAFGTLLQLHGSATDYPYTSWGEASAGAWSGFTLATYVQA